jgi:hypothetical protein
MRVVLSAALAAVSMAVVPGVAGAAGGTLTVPPRVQASPGGGAAVDAAFSYPDPSPICTAGVTFTWDGLDWLAQVPVRSGALCVASAPGAAAPAGRAAAGAHTVCGVAGRQFSDCKTVTVVGAAPAPGGAAAPAPSEAPAAPAAPAPTAAPATPTGPAALVTRPLERISALRRMLALVALLAAAGLLVVGGGTAGLLRLRSRRRLARLPKP